MTQKEIEIWMTSYEQGEATVYVENKETGEEIAKCTVCSGDNYTADGLKDALGIDKRYPQLNEICREIYNHNKKIYEQNKRDYSHYYGSREAQKNFGNYPSFENRMK